MSTIQHFFQKPWLYIVILILGILFKFYHLNSKFFWQDEVSTVLYTSGINNEILLQRIPVNQIVSFEFYYNLLHHRIKDYSLADEVAGILSDTHLTPAHYIFLTVWYRVVGDTDIDYRLFSLFIFILSLPFMFLLAKSLFSSQVAGWISISLYAVSPLIHYEAQEARYYIVWVFFFIVSNYLFLQAIKYNSLLWWFVYSVASILALYTSMLSGPFIFGHLLYVFLFKKQLRVQYIISLLVIVLGYLPWLYHLSTYKTTIQGGLAWHTLFHSSYFSIDLLFFQLLGFVKSLVLLFDWNLYLMWFNGMAASGIYTALVVDLIMLAFVCYSIYYLFTRTPKETRWFVILIILPLSILLYVSDVIRNGFTSVLWRYQIVNMVGIILVVTNLLKNKIEAGKWVYIGIYFGVVILGIVSMLRIATSPCWMTRPDCDANVEETQIISQASHPLIITDFSGFGFVNFLAVLNESKAKNADIMFCQGKIPNVKEMITRNNYSDIYLIKASDTLAQQVKSQFGESMIPHRTEVNMFSPQIWHVKL